MLMIRCLLVSLIFLSSQLVMSQSIEEDLERIDSLSWGDDRTEIDTKMREHALKRIRMGGDYDLVYLREYYSLRISYIGTPMVVLEIDSQHRSQERERLGEALISHYGVPDVSGDRELYWEVGSSTILRYSIELAEATWLWRKSRIGNSAAEAMKSLAMRSEDVSAEGGIANLRIDLAEDIERIDQVIGTLSDEIVRIFGEDYLHDREYYSVRLSLADAREIAEDWDDSAARDPEETGELPSGLAVSKVVLQAKSGTFTEIVSGCLEEALTAKYGDTLSEAAGERIWLLSGDTVLLTYDQSEATARWRIMEYEEALKWQTWRLFGQDTD
jgi:hypothetical protein